MPRKPFLTPKSDKYIIICYDWCGELHLSEYSTLELARIEYMGLKNLYEDNVWLTKVINLEDI